MTTTHDLKVLGISFLIMGYVMYKIWWLSKGPRKRR